MLFRFSSSFHFCFGEGKRSCGICSTRTIWKNRHSKHQNQKAPGATFMTAIPNYYFQRFLNQKGNVKPLIRPFSVSCLLVLSVRVAWCPVHSMLPVKFLQLQGEVQSGLVSPAHRSKLEGLNLPLLFLSSALGIACIQIPWKIQAGKCLLGSFSFPFS